MRILNGLPVGFADGVDAIVREREEPRVTLWSLV